MHQFALHVQHAVSAQERVHLLLGGNSVARYRRNVEKLILHGLSSPDFFKRTAFGGIFASLTLAPPPGGSAFARTRLRLRSLRLPALRALPPLRFNSRKATDILSLNWDKSEAEAEAVVMVAVNVVAV